MLFCDQPYLFEPLTQYFNLIVKTSLTTFKVAFLDRVLIVDPRIIQMKCFYEKTLLFYRNNTRHKGSRN